MGELTLKGVPSRDGSETQEQRARRLFDEMARNIGREAVNHLKTMYPEILSDRGKQSKSWERRSLITFGTTSTGACGRS